MVCVSLCMKWAYKWKTSESVSLIYQPTFLLIIGILCTLATYILLKQMRSWCNSILDHNSEVTKDTLLEIIHGLFELLFQLSMNITFTVLWVIKLCILALNTQVYLHRVWGKWHNNLLPNPFKLIRQQLYHYPTLLSELLTKSLKSQSWLADKTLFFITFDTIAVLSTLFVFGAHFCSFQCNLVDTCPKQPRLDSNAFEEEYKCIYLKILW